MTLIDEILNQLSQYYYTKGILFFLELCTVIIGLKYFKNLKGLKFFFWYSLIDFILFTVSLLLDSTKTIAVNKIHILNNSINASVSILEVIVYFLYFNTHLKVLRNRKHLQILLISLLIMVSVYFLDTSFYNTQWFFKKTHTISTIAFLIILVLGIINLKFIMSNPKIISLHTEANFWITIGIMYYSAVSVPYYYFRGFFSINNELKYHLDSILFYSPFTINIICILIAFLCKKQAKS